MTEARASFMGKRVATCFLATFVVVADLVPAPGLLLAAERHSTNSVRWCKQSSFLTTEAYKKKFPKLPGGGIGMKAFTEVPSDVIIIPEHKKYVSTWETQIYAIPEKGAIGVFARQGTGSKGYWVFWDICKVVGPRGDSWLVLDQSGFLVYVPTEYTTEAALYFAEARLKNEIKDGKSNKGNKN